MKVLRQFVSVAAAGLLIGLAACSTPAQRISTALAGYGVPRAQADCIGGRLAGRLSNAQLRRLQELGDGSVRRLGLREIALRLTDPDDPELVSQMLRAGLACAL